MTNAPPHDRSNEKHDISTGLDGTFEELLEESRERAPNRFSRSERNVAISFGAAFVAVAVAMAAFLPSGGAPSLLVATLLIALYAVVSRVEFEIGSGLAMPTQLVLVPMLFILPPPLVPLFAVAGLVVGDLIDVLRRRKHPERTFLALSAAWHTVGPALVLAVFGSGEPTWADWPVYVCALAAQFVVEGAMWGSSERLALGVSPKLVLRFLSWSWTIDSLLAPVGLAIAAAQTTMPSAFLLALPLAGVLALLARERRLRIERALELARAYRRANEEARCDALTGLGNRLAWEEALVQLDAERARSLRPASVIVVDLDGLKRANDLRGHHFGDELLQALAAAVRASVRETDVVARIGGDELAVLLPDTGEQACAESAARVADVLARHRGVDGFPLSAAVGYAAAAPGETLAATQRLADARMYERKLAPRAGWAS